jgi:hypothetical protein
MAVHKIFSGSDIIFGNTAVGNGDSKPVSYEDRSRTIHIPDTGRYLTAAELATRYLHHGGDNGSGNWEH